MRCNRTYSVCSGSVVSVFNRVSNPSRGRSSARQSACFASRKSWVQVPSSPLTGPARCDSRLSLEPTHSVRTPLAGWLVNQLADAEKIYGQVIETVLSGLAIRVRAGGDR